MQISPEPDDFAERYAAGAPQVVWTRVVADLETPVSAYMKLAAGKPNSFLLESVEGGAIRGRYSFIGIRPDLIWRCNGTSAEINRRALENADRFEPEDATSIDSLRSLLDESRIDLPEELPPMAAGLFGYMSYDTIRLVENIPDTNPAAMNTPDGLYMRPTVMAVFDTIEDIITIVTPVRPNSAVSAFDAYDAAVSRLDAACTALERSVPHGSRSRASLDEMPEPVSNMSADDYKAMVSKAKDYIRAGDIFQVVLSQRFETPFNLAPFALYRALRRTNPSPFLFFLDFGGFSTGDFSIVGSSPEILVRLRDGKVTIRPIAGTRPRGANKAEDDANAASLLNDPKELAEHLMLLDLGRNDVGRVAKIGSVTVTDRNIVEYYSHVMHIVSNVEGDAKDGIDVLTALMAGFPAGTVSGAPKVRAMEIIDELEPERRGIYAGCIGYFGADGAMDTCITLRTAVVKDGTMSVQAGAGIVYDSDPTSEYQECVNKAKALVRAAEEAVRFSIGSN
ncbi:anthranilate synthase component I [Hwanghaeella grinnelliae]|uniref:Anthranilate synthase component 1 n=1 Tax=Hwanghaeella grinnelliae TaxID=2500179 RepID=A0A3S2ZCF4_9PROT|nr:anthranilate synthase component I [Hwanghaeella grinnelliae]RVU39342.1 anthranilate synthase component I [Hwanghaeella grinnelliae]